MHFVPATYTTLFYPHMGVITYHCNTESYDTPHTEITAHPPESTIVQPVRRAPIEPFLTNTQLYRDKDSTSIK